MCSSTAGSRLRTEKLMATTRSISRSGIPGQASTMRDPRFHASARAAARPDRLRPSAPDHPRPLKSRSRKMAKISAPPACPRILMSSVSWIPRHHLQHLPDIVRLPFADDQLLAVAEREQPALAAQRRHLAHVVHVHQRVAVHALKDRPAQAGVDVAQRLGGHVALAGGDDPDDLALGLEGQHVVEIQQVVLLAGAAHHFAAVACRESACGASRSAGPAIRPLRGSCRA